MVFQGVVAVVDSLTAVQVFEFHVTSLPNGTTTIVVGKPTLRRRVGYIFLALEEAIHTEAPDLAEFHTFIILSRIDSRQGVGGGCIFGNLAVIIPQGALHIIVEWLACKIESILPTDAQFPSISTHICIVALWSTVAINGRQFITDHIHIGGVLAVDVETKIETVLKHIQVDTEIVRGHLLPSQTLWHWCWRIGVSEEITILHDTTLANRHRG